MNINTGMMSLNVSNILVKRNLDKEQQDNAVALKINENLSPDTLETDTNVTNENLMASESSVKSTEMAEELLKRTKDNILQRSTMAILSQSNKKSSDVIALL